MEENLKQYLKTKDFLVTGESFDLLYDSNFDMLVTAPKPSDENLPKYYESEEYISHTDEKGGIVSFLYQSVKKYSLKSKLKLISKYAGNNATILDIGAGTGDFLVAAKNKNYDVSGIEVNQQARERAKEKGIILSENISEISNMQFDVITLWHVLEHLPNLKDDIIKIKNLVKPGGHLIIAVPNFKSFDAKFYKEYWAAFDVPRHLWHFSKNSIPKLAGSKMRLVKIKPMIFDSFYVSLLSEKYKSGSVFSLKATFIGLWSNLSALRTKEYSSLIYVLKKEN